MKFGEIRPLLNTDWWWMVESGTGNFEEIDFSRGHEWRLDKYKDAIVERITPGDNYLEVIVKTMPGKKKW